MPRPIRPQATVTVNVDDASLAVELSAYITVIADGGFWTLSGAHDLAGVRGKLDLKLDPRETTEGLLTLEETGGESGRCGSLRLATRLRGEGVWVTRAEGTWRAGSCPN